jgi:hypothetical protein
MARCRVRRAGGSRGGMEVIGTRLEIPGGWFKVLEEG